MEFVKTITFSGSLINKERQQIYLDRLSPHLVQSVYFADTKSCHQGTLMRRFLCLTVSLLFIFVATAGIGLAASTTHKVKSGDNLHTIAKKYGVSVDKIKSANNLTSIKLSIGQVLVVNTDGPVKTRKGKKAAPPPEPVISETDGDFIEYRAKRGDTVDKLALKFNVDRDELAEANDLGSTRKLKPGKVILIPRTDTEDREEYVSLSTTTLKPWKTGEEKYMLVKVAKSFMGAPYRYGGETVRGLDCSAYVKKIYDIFDVQLPRSAREQFQYGSKVTKDELAVGDLVFFRTKRYVKYPTHVGIYIGDGNFIHASSNHNKLGVKIDSLSSEFYTRTYTGAVRVKRPIEDSAAETSRPETAANNS